MEDNIVNFKGIKFHNNDFASLFSVIKEGGYLVAPAASALTSISDDRKYHDALIQSDIAILDSGFFCVLLRIFKGKKVSKYSGYLFLKNFLNLDFDKETRFLSIDPNQEESKANTSYLSCKNIKNLKNYVAPQYINEDISDNNLLEEINRFQPRYIIINLSGGIQELLALYIKKIWFFSSTIVERFIINCNYKRALARITKTSYNSSVI